MEVVTVCSILSAWTEFDASFYYSRYYVAVVFCNVTTPVGLLHIFYKNFPAVPYLSLIHVYYKIDVENSSTICHKIMILELNRGRIKSRKRKK